MRNIKHHKTINHGMFWSWFMNCTRLFRVSLSPFVTMDLYFSLTLHTRQPSFAPGLIRKSHRERSNQQSEHIPRHTTSCSHLLSVTKSQCHWFNNTACTQRLAVNLPAMTVLFPSSTARGSLDSDESITFPSISLPWSVKTNQDEVRNDDDDVNSLCFCIIFS